MQRFLLACLLLIISYSLSAQEDTIRVQTLTWDDDFRSGYYQFPDEPDQQFRKILMRYNMRCHDNAVGSGSVGCREWDYSCNTFITDPTRLDSAQATHPSHLISGFSGTDFDFSDAPYFNYTQYQQIQTSFTDTSSLSVAEIGGTDVPLYLGSLDNSFRQQHLYPAEELIAAGLIAGPITALQLNTSTPGSSAPFLRLRLKAVDQDELSAEEPVLDGFTEVYFQSTDLTTSGWFSFPFSQAFMWDGTSDLLLDCSINGAPSDPLVIFGGEETTANFSAGALQSENAHYLGLQGSGSMEVPSEALGMTQAVTIAFWSYGLSDVLPSNTTIFEAVDGVNRRQMNVHLPWSDSNIYWDCGNDGSGYDRIFKNANPADFEGRWNHWAFTKDATLGEMKIYLNGELWHSGTGHTRPIMATRMMVGSNASGSLGYPGDLDNFSMWNQALNAEEVQAIMYTEDIPGAHPAITSLIAHYPFNEGTGLETTDIANGFNANLIGPNWQTYRGKDLQFDWLAIPYRFAARWEQGVHTILNETIAVIDSTAAYPNTVVSYVVNGTNDLEISDIYETYAATETYLYDEQGNILETYPLDADGTINITDLNYHTKTLAKFEILSLVTPYGNGLSLGSAGKTFTFDMTDFAPILKGERFLSMEMGGQFQEEMDIEFLFITGTPPRDVIDIENVWPFARGWYTPIQEDAVFEPRNLLLNPNADTYKVRTSVTGHGQNGEFVSREHYLNIDGGTQDFQFDVWKSCGQNPIYPQGGTWIFDRAGWCPGMATDVHEFYLPENNTGSVQIDYGVNGAPLTEANYLVSTQLVSYGPLNFTLDAELTDIIRPSNKVEYERLNPICDDPIVVVRNNGSETITSLGINYGVEGGTQETYNWNGTLEPETSIEIALPVDDYRFWETNAEDKVFQASVFGPNDATDDHPINNMMSTAFEPALIIDYDDPIIIELRTNNRPNENRYTITDGNGEVVMERNNLATATLYRDVIDLGPGCYGLTLEDDGADGLDFWYWAAVGQNVGTGSISIRRQLAASIFLGIQNFNPDFGGDLYFNFVIPEAVNTTEGVDKARRFSIFPNPASQMSTLELSGFDGEMINWQLLDMTGRLWQQGQTQVSGRLHEERISLNQLPAGMYLVKVMLDGRVYTNELVIMPR